MFCVVEVMMSLTTAGDGSAPPCALAYAWMTRAAVPAVSGEASLVPPVSSTDAGLPKKFVQAAYRFGNGLHSAQFRSPGATTSTVRPFCAKPAELRPLMLLFSQPFTPGALIAPMPVCA